MLDKLPIDQLTNAVNYWASKYHIHPDDRDELLSESLLWFAGKPKYWQHEHGFSITARRTCKEFKKKSKLVYLGDPEFQWMPGVPHDSPLHDFLTASLNLLPRAERRLLEILSNDPNIDTDDLCKQLRLRPDSLYTLRSKLRTKCNHLRLQQIFRSALAPASEGDGLALCLSDQERAEVAFSHASWFLFVRNDYLQRGETDQAFLKRCLDNSDYFLSQCLDYMSTNLLWLIHSPGFFHTFSDLARAFVSSEELPVINEFLDACQVHVGLVDDKSSTVRAEEWVKSWNLLRAEFANWFSTDVCKYFYFRHNRNSRSSSADSKRDKRVQEGNTWITYEIVTHTVNVDVFDTLTRIEHHLFNAARYQFPANQLKWPKFLATLQNAVPSWLAPHVFVTEGDMLRETFNDEVREVSYEQHRTEKWREVGREEIWTGVNLSPAVSIGSIVIAGWSKADL